MRYVLPSLACLSFPLLIAAQSATPTTTKPEGAGSVSGTGIGTAGTPSTISVESRLVNLPVVVRDKKGALIQNLAKDDFSLQVDGHPQVIRYFDKDKDLPLTLGLLVDTSESQRSVIDDERAASSTFIDQMLTTEKDKAFVIQFARSAELLEDTTSSHPKLQAALRDIGSPIPNQNSDTDDNSNSGSSNDGSSNGNSGNKGGRRRQYSGGTTLYDSLFLASDELMPKQHGRKAVIILSDGNDRGSKESLAKSIESAQRADTIVYAIYFKGEEHHDQDNSNRRQGGMGRGGGFPGGGRFPGGGGGYPGGGGGGNAPSNQQDGKKTLDRIARETGGRMFEVSKKLTTAEIYTQIAEELRAQYRLGYTPDQAAAAEGYHKIDLALTKSSEKNLIVQTRDGYYGK